MAQLGAAMNWLPPFVLGLWGAVLLQAWGSGRLNLLLQADFHWLVLVSGLLLLALAGLAARFAPKRRSGRTPALVMLLAAPLVLLIPPRPSFSTLAANRSSGALEGESETLTFLSPPEQRSLTDWVRLLRSQPDPELYRGDPVRISGFVMPTPQAAPVLARLTVRCCLADATPVGIPVIWPEGESLKADEWLAVSGEMGVERVGGVLRSVVIAERVQPIPKPKRPFEP
ncbi:MAG: TIGR03943 family protein [Synechococcus sp. MED-G67]|nr:MAG: TIGR03943 family protein [Synechococcus sp. MED-G67]HCA61947.1 TIGR03943 family protein [Synechococcales bacterium UBA8647]